jgi:hypothetical protein
MFLQHPFAHTHSLPTPSSSCFSAAYLCAPIAPPLPTHLLQLPFVQVRVPGGVHAAQERDGHLRGCAGGVLPPWRYREVWATLPTHTLVLTHTHLHPSRFSAVTAARLSVCGPLVASASGAGVRVGRACVCAMCRDLAPAITVLHMFLSSPKPTLRYASVSTLSKVRSAHHRAVARAFARGIVGGSVCGSGAADEG